MDEFDIPRIPRAAQKEMTEQLIEDGYGVDVKLVDEDLDLVPPRPLDQRWSCCRHPTNCITQ